MANINGLSIKKVRSFVGPEGHVYQGDLYLGKKKIAFWSQDANGGIEDHLTMEPEYSEAKLRKAIIAANSDKAIVLHPNGSNNSFTIDYDIEELMYIEEMDDVFDELVKEFGLLTECVKL